MNPIDSLNPDNANQIKRYLKFLRQKKDAALRSMNNDFADAIEDRLNDDMFSKEDVLDFVDYLKGSIKNQVSNDIGNTINMSALAVAQLLENAQSSGIELNLDTAAIENSMLLDAIEKMSLDAMAGRTPSKPIGKLTSLKDEAKIYRDESERLENSNKQLQERFSVAQERATAAQGETSRLMREKKELLERLSALQSTIDGHMSADSKEMETNEYRERINRMEDELQAAQGENTKRVNETTQFLQMKKLMQSQAVKIKDLRRKLQKYEPDDCKGDDDDF